MKLFPSHLAGMLSGWFSYSRVKRLIDVIFGCIFLLLFGVVMLLIAIAIKTTSPGPVLFRQTRIGKDGQSFYMLKFRSMYFDSDQQLHREHVRRLILENTRPEDLGLGSLKLKHDARVTKVGKFIRALSLDELPQLFNVLRNEMSLVGPRPPMPYEYELYDGWARQRLKVLPGITGYWQVFARNKVSFEEMVQLDLDYIARMNLWLDLKIILLTPLEMLRGGEH